MAFKITEADFEKVYGKKQAQPQAQPVATPTATQNTSSFKITEDDFDKVFGPSRQKEQETQLFKPAQTAGEKSPAVSYADKVKTPVPTPTITAKEKYGNTLYVPASMYAVENEKRNKLNYIVNDNYKLTSGAGIANPYAQLDYVNEAERMAISDLVAKKDYESAYRYLLGIERDLNARQAEGEHKQVVEFAKEHPLLASGVSVGSSLFKPIEYAGNMVQYATDKMQGKQTDFDANAENFAMTRYSNAVNEGVMQDDGIVEQLLKGTGMSIANQTAISSLVGAGTLTELVMAAQAAQDSLYENTKRGLSRDEAMLNAAGKGVITYWAERFFPSEKLLGIGKADVVDTLWKQIGKASLAEGIEEVAENVVSNIWDSAQLGDKSEFAQMVQQYKDRGYDKKDAVVQTMAQKYIYDSLMGFAGGALAGGLMGGGAGIINSTINGRNAKQDSVAKQNDAQTEGKTAEQQPVGIKEYVDTLKESAKGNAENNLNGAYKNTGMTAAQYVENNLDGNYYQEKNKLYFMEKDGKKVPVSKTVHDYAKYLQANRPQVTARPTDNIEQVPYNAQQIASVQQAPQTVEQQIAKDINVPDTNTVNTAPTEAEKQMVRDIGADAAQQEAIKAEAVNRGLGETIEQIDAFSKRTGIKVHYYNGQLGEKILGFREGNDIYIDLREKNKILKTAVHETIHALRSNNSKAYDKLHRQLDALQKNSTRFNVLAEMTGEKYADMGVTDSDANSEEIVAKLSEYIIENPEEFLAKFGKERTFIDAVIDFLKEIKNTIVANFGGNGAEKARVDNALIALEQYLRKEVGETDGGTQFSTDIDYSTKSSYTKSKPWLDEGYLNHIEYNDFCSKVMGLYNGETPQIKTAEGLFIVDVGAYDTEKYVLVLTDGDYSNPSVEEVSFINLKDSEDIQEVKKYVYSAAKEGWASASANVKKIYRDESFLQYTRDDSGHIYEITAEDRNIGSTRRENKSVAGLLQNRSGSIAEDSRDLTGYMDEDLESYDRYGTGNYSVKLADGKTHIFYETHIVGKQAYQIEGIKSKHTTIKEMIADANSKLKSTPKGVSSSFAENSNGTVTNKNGDVVAVDNNGTAQFNIRTFEDGGREYLERYLAKQSDLAEEDKADILSSIDAIYNMVKEYNTAMSSEYPSFTNWCEAKPVIDDNGNVVMSVIVPNGDYKMNIDVSTVCKKRKALDVVLNKMAESGDLSVYSMSQPDIVKMNQIIKRHGFEVACSMCFVDAKRYRIGNWANSFADMYNSIVETIIPEGSDIALDQFNYSGAKIKKVKGRKADSVKTTELRWDEVNRMINDKSVKPIMREMARAIKINPSMRKMLSGGDLISSKGMDNLKMQNPELYKLTNRHMGTAKPKTSHSETPYTNEVLSAKGWTPEKAYAVGGVRIQSFSDYMANMFFDYAQIIADLSAKQLPGHGYTKELDFAKIFGLTGLKINMSAMPKAMDIPANIRAELNKLSEAKRKEHPLYKYYQERAGLDAKGNYLWADESIDVEEAIKLQNTEGYEKNCGIICVGISDAHIRKLMADDNMKMVIPYHKSGINPVVAKMQNIDLYTDYTNEQNTRYAKSGKKLRKNSFQFDFYADLAQTNDPRTTAENYVRDCENRNFLPKFDRFAYKLDADGNRIKGKDGKFVVDENYYKLLIDFRVYDNDGKYAPQGAIKMSYPQNLDQLVQESLKTSEATAAKMDKGIDALLKDIKNEISIKDSDRVNTKPVYSGNYDIKFDTQHSIDIGEEKGTGKYKGKSIKEISEGTISEAQQKRAKAQALLEERQQKTAKLVPEKFAREQAKKAEDGLPESVGAMKASEKNITHMVNEYGEMKPGENPARFVSVPVSTDGEDRVSLTARTLLEAPETTEEVQKLLEEGVVEGLFSHDIITDKGALKTALDDIKADGFESIYKEFKRKIKNDIILTKDDMAKVAIMYATANKAGDTKVALDIATDIIARGTTMAQGLQAFRLFKKAAPVDKLWAVDKMAKAIENDIKKKDKNFEGIKVDKALKEKLTAAKTDAEINSVMSDIEQNIADQVPSDWIDKINAWRYVAMLANPRTHIRNILGNTLFVPMKSFKDAIGATIEGGFEKSGKLSKDRRTKSLEAMTLRAKPFKEFASKDFDKAQDIISGQSRYAAKQGVYDKVKVFDNPILEGIRKKNSDWLEAEDIFFLKKAYETAFAQAMISRGLKVSDVENNAKTLNEVRAIAINEAQKATYRDANFFAKGFDNVKKGMRKKARTAESNRGKIGWALGNIVMEGTVPFTKTPSNIIRRGIEYSPIGVINGICDVNKRVKNGDINLAEGIDRLAAGLSGTMIMALGALLSQLGAIRGAGEDDEKQKTIDELKGYQDYSLNIFGVNYTLDWMSPAAMPLFIGAELHKRFVEKEGFRFADLQDVLLNITEPVFDMTMLQGINSALKTAGNSKTNAATRIGENAVINYAGQFVPSFVGRLARTIDDTRRTTYDDKNNDMFNGTMQKFWQRTLNKLPVASKNQIPYMNAWGEADTTENVFVRAFENFASPGYINKIKSGDVNNEVERLYRETGSGKVVPNKPDKYFTENGKKVDMTAEQYENFSKIKGQTSYSLVEKLIKDSSYNKLSDDEKVKIIYEIYSYAGTVAKKDVFAVGQTDTNTKRRKLLDAGVSPMDVFGRKDEIDINGNDKYTKAEVMAFIDKQPGLTKTQKAYMFDVYYTGTSANPYI